VEQGAGEDRGAAKGSGERESWEGRALRAGVPESDVSEWLSPRPPRSSRKRGLRLPSARRFLAVGLILTVVLAGFLIMALLVAIAPTPGGSAGGGTPQAGVIPLFVITGPGNGSHPRFDRPLAAAFDQKGRIYVSDTGNGRVCVFDRNGKFLFVFDGSKHKKGAGQGATKLALPAGIVVADNGEVYVADVQGGRVDVFDSEGNYLRRLPAITGGRSYAPTDVDVRARTVYVTDTFQVLLLRTNGEVVAHIGQAGEAPVDLDHPNGVAVAGSNVIYVSDSNHSQIKAFELSGKLRWVYGAASPNTSPPADTDPVLPRGLAVVRDGSVLFADAGAHRLIRLSAAGKFLAEYGSRGVKPGQFNFPNDVDAQGSRVLVTDKENNRVQVVELQDQSQEE